MAPLNWVTLFIYFSVILMIMSPINYFNLNQPFKEQKSKTPFMVKTTWKW